MHDVKHIEMDNFFIDAVDSNINFSKVCWGYAKRQQLYIFKIYLKAAASFY